MAEKRIYAVADKKAGVCHLVKAATQAQAVGHVVRGQFVAEVASQEVLVDLMTAGKKVEEAGAE